MHRSKSQVRTSILAARRAVPAHVHDAEAADLAGHLGAAVKPGSTVCGYVPVGSEPGSLTLIDTVLQQGATVLLPVAREDPDGTPQPLQWGRYRPGELIPAPFGLREPPPPWLPPDAVAQASLVLVPALAVDRRGVRLGRGAGFYDRTLHLARDAALVAVVRDDEILDRLPAEPHDVRMTHALTPHRGLVALASGINQPG
ncbi:5-formyltetrahydrofolate cyclo-ligase [Mycobacterium sp. Y57]|uniref:5-formyltetrahydrofolate cyclo-ligase n=1 Tax=Mycolicibacterium xanthum TaxID=2796469 RepID=UPI001C852A91|nr:5-formyltetrahydrofolate cyclo-ligase [Mycolicibacterium xanthum]MBX7434157.1 5-formyltetrahydrofolate cyclo-ligase [Mycolicibacterium xanthum]